MKALIIGGNRYFGKRLAKSLVDQEHEVFLLNRGHLDDGLGTQVRRLICDRDDIVSLEQCVKGHNWDVVVDQVCYDYGTAQHACRIFQDKTKRYIFTSSASVYQPSSMLKEKDFQACQYTVQRLVSKEEDYGEAKRQAEAAFVKYASFPFVALRLPMVMAADDYTDRLFFHVDRTLRQKPIYFPNLEANLSFISPRFAAEVLEVLMKISFEGPINAASPDPISLKALMGMVESRVGRSCRLDSRPTNDSHSPFGVKQDWTLDCSMMQNLGLQPPPLDQWLPQELDTLAERSRRLARNKSATPSKAAPNIST